ncbi:hypothetical protein RhiirC2_855672 [Rhizophagus irregularis]|uniref:S-adenosyl-L-methionine-dependent methyltransferase n=1 Tax=Rhizophagus irregularis TaxID=588596 RepID=A0A2N1MLG3_9GLOM|nr:hypothetical protein RhiirC2_855672 [Rhizophagus irregularis]
MGRSPQMDNPIINEDHFKPNITHDLKSFHKYKFSTFNDEDFERLNLDHYLFRFQSGVKVLDVGCGTGIWILDMAKEYHPTNIYIDSQWKYLFSEIKRVLKPGGYLEIMEYRIGYDNPGPISQNRNDQDRWGGEIGLMMLNSYETSQKALNKRFQPGLTEEETDDILSSIASEFDEYKTQLVNFRCYARKN